MLLLLLICFLIVNAGLSGILTATAIEKPKDDPTRRGLLILSAVLIANTTVFLTLYAYYTHGSTD